MRPLPSLQSACLEEAHIRCQAIYLPLSSVGLGIRRAGVSLDLPGTRSQGAGMHPLGRIEELDVNLFSLS
jgi:hypothetical protein